MKQSDPKAPAKPRPSNFIVGQNLAKQPGTNAPDFTGRIAKPDTTLEFPVVLWAGRDKNGELYFSGRMNPTPITDDVMAQLESITDRPVHDATDMAVAGPNLTLRPFQIIAFKHKFKAASALDTPEEAVKRAKRPDFRGRVHPGDGTPVFEIGIWADQDRYGRPILRGKTSYPKPKQRADAAPENDTADDLDHARA